MEVESLDAIRAAIAELPEIIRFESRESRLVSAETVEGFGLVPEGAMPSMVVRAFADVLSGGGSDSASSCDGDAVPEGGGELASLSDEAVVQRCVGEALADVAHDDLRVLESSRGPLFYSSDYMTDAFAHWTLLSEEGDDAATFVDCVREESRIYPRPMKATSLENPPFELSEARLAEVFSSLQGIEGFEDIESTQASNGDVYYYSTNHLSARYAKSLAEWYSVERWESY